MKKLKMLKKCKVFSIPTLIVIIIFAVSYKYIEIIQEEKKELEHINHLNKVSSMKAKVSSMIQEKQKSTVAIALSIAHDQMLAENIKSGNISKDYYTQLISDYKDQTLYKNIWIQILDKNATSLFRSWSDKKGDNLRDVRSDLNDIIESKKVVQSISVGHFTLSIKAMIPIFDNSEFIGIVEVISHFNSISKQLRRFDVDSVVVVKKEFKKQLTNPFTKMFIDGHYVANFDAPTEHMNYLKSRGVENYLNNSYEKGNGYLIASTPIEDINNRIIAYYITFEKMKSISNLYLDYFMFKWIAFGVMGLMLIAIFFSVYFYSINREQKKYYKKIIDSLTNIVVINNKESLRAVNKIFFDYFYEYKSLDDFRSEHECICDLFEKEEGYLQKYMDGVHWMDYLLKNSDREHKVKINYLENVYYFSVSASLVSGSDNYYSTVFTNITEQEKYKNELELMTITDAMSGINNRRYFELKIEDEISRSKRYKQPLSLIIFDIDYFKKVNDKYGHKVGDEVIIEYSSYIASMLRDEDIFCRIGGEEFSIILPHLDRSKAFKVAEKLRSRVEQHKKVLPITMSFGVVEYIMGEEAENVFHRADNALYAAKDAGRNRVKIG